MIRRRRLLTLFIPGLIGLPVLVVLAAAMAGGGQTQEEAPVHDVQWPQALSGLPATVTDLAVDEDGTLWFPVLAPADAGEQMNLLYRYDARSDSVQTFPLPNDTGSPFVARVEVGTGERVGKIIVAWESTLVEVDAISGQVTRLDLPLDPPTELLEWEAPIAASDDMATEGPAPPPFGSLVRIHDIAADQGGTIWVSREGHSDLIAVYPDGSSRMFALPEGAGNPESLAVDGDGRIWATLIRHRTVEVSPGLPPVNAYRFTLRLDPNTGGSEVLPVLAYNLAGRGGPVVAMAGDQPAGVQRLDTADFRPEVLTEFALTMPEDEMDVSVAGEVWYHSLQLKGLVKVAGDSVVTFPLSITGPFSDDSLGVQPLGGPVSTCINCPTPTPQSEIPVAVLGIAAAPDGSAWFSTGDRIGHAVP